MTAKARPAPPPPPWISAAVAPGAIAAVVAAAAMAAQGQWLSSEGVRALKLSTFAGLSTSVGAIIAVVRKPTDATLAFLLGLALGVMLTLSVVELWVKNGIEFGWVMITIATLAGAALYYFAQPYFPDFEVRCCFCRALVQNFAYGTQPWHNCASTSGRFGLRAWDKVMPSCVRA
jgi:hypothetical protein